MVYFNIAVRVAGVYAFLPAFALDGRAGTGYRRFTRLESVDADVIGKQKRGKP